MKKKRITPRQKDTNWVKVILIILSISLLILLLSNIGTTTRYLSRAYDKISVKPSSVSGSKLGIFIINGSIGAEKITDKGPRVIKVMDPQANSAVMNLVRKFKQKYPEGIVVVRFYEGDAPGYGIDTAPEQAARHYWENFLKQKIEQIPQSDRGLFDYISGPNEYNNTPKIITREDAAWYAKFWTGLSELIAQENFHPLMGEIPVGNLDDSHMAELVPALRIIKSLGGTWSYHAYSDEYTTDENVEIWYALRYRRFYDYFRQNAPDLSDMQMILTEGGIDHLGNGLTDGWNGTIPPRGDAQRYKNWLTWFDREIQKDDYIRGVTLFQIGNDTDWRSFDLEPIADWLADYLAGNPDGNIPAGVLTSSPTPIGAPIMSLSPIPTPTPCIPDWCFIKQSDCCFDPICLVMGKIKEPDNRCTGGRDYRKPENPTSTQNLFERLKQLFLKIFPNNL